MQIVISSRDKTDQLSNCCGRRRKASLDCQPDEIVHNTLGSFVGVISTETPQLRGPGVSSSLDEGSTKQAHEVYHKNRNKLRI